MKFARLSSRRTCDSFATLQAHMATALRVNARQACEHRTDALRLVKIYLRYVICLGKTVVRLMWNRLHQQAVAFQKSWRSFSPITVCIIAQCQCRTGGGGGVGGMCPPPPPPRRGRGECPKKIFRTFICTVMFWWCLECFGVVWGISRP